MISHALGQLKLSVLLLIKMTQTKNADGDSGHEKHTKKALWARAQTLHLHSWTERLAREQKLMTHFWKAASQVDSIFTESL